MSTTRTDDHLLEDVFTPARTHRIFADTAATAAGGELASLHPDPEDPQLWHAIVRRPDGRLARVRMDSRLGTVFVSDEAEQHRAGRRGSRAA